MREPIARRMRLGRRASLAVLAAALPIATIACASDARPPTAGPDAPAGTIAPVQSGDVAISARDNEFDDQQITVTVGSKLTWTNDGRNDHNIVGVDDTPFKVATADFKPKAQYSYTVTTPGTYHYYCSIHGTATKGMEGTVQVVAKS
jgi:plastocyanin